MILVPKPITRRQTSVAVAAAGALALAVVVATWHLTRVSDDHDDGRRSGGPLGILAKDGGFAADPPPKAGADYAVTFGGFLLCSTTSAVPEIERVVLGPTPPSGSTAFIRTVSPDLVKATPQAQRDRLLPNTATWGSPPGFREPYVAGKGPVGTYARLAPGFRVDESCEEKTAVETAIDTGKVPTSSYLELMIVIPASGKDGAESDEFTIEYSADGQEYSLKTPWQMVVCDRAKTIPPCQEG